MNLIKKICLVTLTFCSLVLSHAVFADNVFVGEIKGIGGANDLVDAERELIRSSLLRLGHQVVADESKADFSVVAKIVMLGKNYILHVEKRKAGQVLFATEMKASSADELDTVTHRAVRAAVNESKQEEAANVDEVTDKEIESNNRKITTHNHRTIGFGPAIVGHLDSEALHSQLRFGWAWGMRDVSLSLRWNLLLPLGVDTGKRATGMHFGIGMSYYLSDQATAPYVDGSFGYSYYIPASPSLLDLDAVNGFGASAGGGVTFFRTAKVNLSLFGSFETVFNSDGQGLPMIFSAGVTLGY